MDGCHCTGMTDQCSNCSGIPGAPKAVDVHLRSNSDGMEIVRVVIPGDDSTPSGFIFYPAAGMFVDAKDIVRLAAMPTVNLMVA